MDSNLLMIFLGAILVVGAGLVGLFEKLSKKATQPEDVEAIKTEKRYGWYAFVVAAIGAVLSLISGYSGWKDNIASSRKQDSTQHVNESLSYKLINSQEKLLKIQDRFSNKQDTLASTAKTQLGTAIKGLEKEENIISLQNSLIQKEYEIAELNKAKFQQILGDTSAPILRLDVTSTEVDSLNNDKLLTINIYLMPKGSLPIYSISGYLTNISTDNLEGKQDETKYIGAHTKTIFSRIYEIFSTGIIYPNDMHLVISKSVFDLDNFYRKTIHLHIQWNQGSRDYKFDFLRDKKLKLFGPIVLTNGWLIKPKKDEMYVNINGEAITTF